MFSNLIIILFCFDIINRILSCCVPALDDDGGEGDKGNGEEGQGEEPPIDRCALGETL